MTTIMDVKMVLKKSSQLQSPSFTHMVGQHLLHPSMVDHDRKLQFECLGRTLSDFITDPGQNPDTIIDLLATYLPNNGWFSHSTAFQNVVAFYCLQALAKRKTVFQGSWKKLLRIVIKIFGDIENEESPIISRADYSDEIWLKTIQKLCSQEECPDPCLRLELIRLHTLFIYLFGNYDYDKASMRESIINTLFDIQNMHSSLTLDQIYMTAGSLHKTLSKYSLDIQSILKKDHPKSKQIMIFGALIKITGYFANLEKERGCQRTNINSHLLACSTFLGLIKKSKTTKILFNISILIKTLQDKPFLIDSTIDTIRAISDAAFVLSVGSYYNGIAINLHSKLKDLIVYMFYKHYVDILPMQLHLREVNGGISSATERHLRYFSDNVQPYVIEEYNRFVEYGKISLLWEWKSDSADDFLEYDSEGAFGI